MTLTKTTFNGERGYTEMQGQRIEFDEKQIEEDKVNIKKARTYLLKLFLLYRFAFQMTVLQS